MEFIICYCSTGRVMKWTEWLYWKLYSFYKCSVIVMYKTWLDLIISYWMHWFLYRVNWMALFGCRELIAKNTKRTFWTGFGARNTQTLVQIYNSLDYALIFFKLIDLKFWKRKHMIKLYHRKILLCYTCIACF